MSLSNGQWNDLFLFAISILAISIIDGACTPASNPPSNPQSPCRQQKANQRKGR